MAIKVSLMQFLTFKAKVSSDAKYNYIFKQKYNDGYHPSFDYWKDFREATWQLPYNNGDLSVLDKAIDKVRPDRKANYTKTVNNLKRFVKDKNAQFFEVGKAKWSMEDKLLVNASPDVGMIVDGKRYFVKIFPNVQQNTIRLDARAANSILTLLQETDTNFNATSGKFAVLRVNSARLFTAEDIDERAKRLLTIDAKNFIDFWEAA